MLAASFPLFDAFLTILWVFLFVFWIWTIVSILVDVFRSDDLSGLGKAAWFLFIVFLPLLGVLGYLIVRGSGMAARSLQHARAQREAMDQYIRDVTGTAKPVADQLATLSDLHDRGVLSDEEFTREKDRLLAA